MESPVVNQTATAPVQESTWPKLFFVPARTFLYDRIAVITLFESNFLYILWFSSLPCGRGNNGQTNYGMANSVMERIFVLRKRDGFPALAIQWGAIGDYGRWLSSPPKEEEIVISGMSGRLPESKNIYEFKDNLMNKRDMVTEVYPNWKNYHSLIPTRIAKIPEKDKFDAGYFGVHYRQADNMEPMMRKFLEVAIEAILDAGVNLKELEGSKTGVFVGACWADVENRILSEITDSQQFKITGYLRAFIAHRISYYLKLKGPSCIIDTVCSSSSHALEMAFRAIRTGQCDSALVGGTNILIHPQVSVRFARLGVLSKDGCCKVFDQDADGYARGEAVACIFLQKRKDARRIYAQVIYSKVNCDGFKEQSITFPSKVMQQQLMTEIFQDSGIHPSELSYMEAHAAGTQVGDTEEVEAIDNAVAKNRQKPLLIGSVKSNIGHTEPSAGLSSLIKVLIAMETGQISPNIHLKKAREGMNGIKEGRMQIVTELTALQDNESIVGINSFGIGGTNCHLLIRRFNKKKSQEKLGNLPRLVCCSGRTEKAVRAIIDHLNQRPVDSEYISLYHQIFKENIDNHYYRGYILISEEKINKFSIKQLPTKLPSLSIMFGSLRNNFKVIGNYMTNFPIFLAFIKRTDDILSKMGININAMLKEKKDFENEELGALAIQTVIADILKLLKVEASIVLSDSKERNLVAAYFTGNLTLEETLVKAAKMVKHSRKSKETAIDIMEYKNKYNKSQVMLNISDELNDKHLSIVKNNKVQFMEILGSLYQQGFNLQLHKLYPEIKYPVSRGTPMISPVIKWNHEKSWFTYQYKERENADIYEIKHSLSVEQEEYKYLRGHVTDGRNLFPAMGYLYLVWDLFSKNSGLSPTDMAVCFENCKFIRAITIPKRDFFQIAVSIQKASGNFEICEKESLVVSGRIYSLKDAADEQEHSIKFDFKAEDPTMIMEQNEIYRELHLRGYNYKDLFKGIVRCDAKATNGLIKWNNNWVTFMDAMLQMEILRIDSRLLYVPIGIRKLTIYPIKHLKLIQNMKNEGCLIPIKIYKKINTIKSGGIEIVGLLASSIAKRKNLVEPILEKYEFVPNKTELSLNESVRVNIQILLENSLENDIKVVELIDNFTNSESRLLLLPVRKALEDTPSVKPNFIISTKNSMEEIPGIIIEDFKFTSESKLNLIVGSKILQRPDFMKQALNALGRNGCILTKDEHPEFVTPEDIEILTEHKTEDGQLILFRKSKNVEDITFIELTSDKFGWLPKLQNALESQKSIIVYSQNQPSTGILGLVNCIRREPGGSRVRCFFIIDKAPKFNHKNPFYQDQIRKNLAFNVYKNQQWGTYRHLLLEDVAEIPSEHCYVNSTVKGDLSSLKWIEGPLTSENKHLIYTYYSPLNFKDILLASGRISVDAVTRKRIEQECILGFEFSGKDASGNRIMGMAKSGALGTLLTADPDLLWSVPDQWTLEDAATVPVVYLTVLYALLMVSELKPKTSILIHSATGGIGIAAINVALHHKCEVFVTVGTEAKRKYVKSNFPQIPANHIGNSRDTSFEEMIKLETKGRGVDIVLNSLSEEKLKASVRCLARGGKVMEISRYDLDNNTSLNLVLMREEKSYHGVMLDQTFANNPEFKAQLSKKIAEGLKLGYVKPLPRTIFNMDQLETAFRYMTTGNHIGKVMIRIRDEQINDSNEKKVFSCIPRFHCCSDKSYVIVGGLGGFGLELADWLVLRGAKSLTLVSRTGVRNGYQRQRIEILTSRGICVSVDTTDLTTKQGCFNFIQKTNKLIPIDGIFNLAAVLQDAQFEDQTEEKFSLCFAAKASITKYLDNFTRKLCPNLRYFVVFSSLSCGRGNVGQTNYGMANSIMERICESRKRDGFPALAIQWGAIGDVGFVAKMQKENKEFVIGGTLQQKINSCLDVLNMFLKQDHPVVSSMVVAEKRKNYGSFSAVEAAAKILGIKDLKTVSQHATMAELGLDSMTRTELIQILENNYEIYVTSKDIRSLTFANLAEIMNKKKNIENIKSETELGIDMILQHIRGDKSNQLQIIKMPSRDEIHDKNEAIFVLPGIEGLLKPLETVTKNLNAHALGVCYTYKNPEKTIAETAQKLLPLILDKIFHDKPFHIMGYSFGGIVTLELASLLEEKGYFGKIILIDASPAYVTSSLKKNLSADSDEALQMNVLSRIMTLLLLPIDFINENKDKLMKCDNFESRVDTMISLIPSNKQKLDKQAAIAWYSRLEALFHYKFNHKKLKSTVHLFRAKYPIVDDPGDDYQLSALCEKPVNVIDFNGNHVTILEQSEVVEAIKKIIEA